MSRSRSFPSARRTASSRAPPTAGSRQYFYPRENHFLFKVNVPQDWDRKKELVWTLTVNGKTEQAQATLLDVWEIDRKVEVSNNGGVQISNDLINKDQPPVVKIDPIGRPKAGSAGHDHRRRSPTMGFRRSGKPRPPRPLEPSLRGAPPSPVNVPMPTRPRPPQGTVRVVARLSRPGGRRLRSRRLHQGRGRQGRR